MMTVFVGLILFMIVVLMIVNGSFLEKYYISNKKSEFIKAYTCLLYTGAGRCGERDNRF